MATNLSALIGDAFTVYSESYRKIGTIGVKIVDLDKLPGQPQKYDQLRLATQLLTIISQFITLNGGGTAIIGVKGDMGMTNALLLKLKRVVRLFDLPAFPTPLTDLIISLSGGSGGASSSATYITVAIEAALAQSRRLQANGGLTLDDGGAQGNITIEGNYLNLGSVDTSANPMVLDMDSVREMIFGSSANITGAKTIVINNATNARRLQWRFTLSGVLTTGSHDLTMPASVKMSDARVVGTGPIVWRPWDLGEYEMIATTYDGITWLVRISDVFS